MEISGYIALLLAFLVGRIANERGLHYLNDKEKVRLLDGFSKARSYGTLPVLVLVAIYFLLLSQTHLSRSVLTICYFVFLIGIIVARTILSHKKFKMLEIPTSYQKCFLIGQLISLAGLAWFFYACMRTIGLT